MDNYSVNDAYKHNYSNERNPFLPNTSSYLERVVPSHKFTPPMMNSCPFSNCSARMQYPSPYPSSHTYSSSVLNEQQYQRKLKLNHKTLRSFMDDSVLAFEQEKTKRNNKTVTTTTSNQMQLSHYNHVAPILPKSTEPLQLIRWTQRPKFATCYWKEEKTVCYQVDANNVCVTRRQDNDMVNGTKLLNVTGMSRGRRDGILKNDKTRVVVKSGSIHLKGVWIPFQRAKELAFEYGIRDILYPLLLNDPTVYLQENKKKLSIAFGDSIQDTNVNDLNDTEPPHYSPQEDNIPPSLKIQMYQSPEDASTEQQSSLHTALSSAVTTPSVDYIIHPTFCFTSLGLNTTSIPSDGSEEYTSHYSNSEKTFDPILYNQSFQRIESYYNDSDSLQSRYCQTADTTNYRDKFDHQLESFDQRELIPIYSGNVRCTYTLSAPPVPEVIFFDTHIASTPMYRYDEGT